MESITQGRAVVQTTRVDQTTSGQLPIEYRLTHKDQRWAVYDVIVDGVSLALNYQAQFDQVIRSASYDTLLGRIKGKVAEESPWRAPRDRLPGQQQGTGGTIPVTSESGESSTSIPIGMRIRAQGTYDRESIIA